MKKIDPFSGIPAVPTSIAGQWLAFSHMANHYRKLLNVKPRVNSSAPLKPSPSSAAVPPISSYLKGEHLKTPCHIPECPKGHGAKGLKPKVKAITTTAQGHGYPPGLESTEEDSYPATPQLNLKRGANKLIKNRTNKDPTKTFSESMATFSNYHQLYGPSSIKSSTDCALVSDCEYSSPEPEEPPRVGTMGVAEKIKVFLDNLHHFETKPLRTSRPKTKASTTPSKGTPSGVNLKVKVKEGRPCSRCNRKTPPPDPQSLPPVMTSRESRHANCFIPISLSPGGTPTLKKRTTPSGSGTPGTGRKQGIRVPGLAEAISKTKQIPGGSGGKAINSEKKGVAKYKSQILVGGDMDKIDLVTGNDKKKRYRSGASTGSVGTIRGSEELSTEVIQMTSKSKKVSRSRHNIMEADYEQVPTREREKGHDHGASRTRTPSAGYCSLMSSTATGSGGGGGGGKVIKVGSTSRVILPNKDSSRDSAYGFSSGESRITTRESTPEKLANKGRRKQGGQGVALSGKRDRRQSALSTVASSLNFNESSDKQQQQQDRKKSRKSRMTTEDKYLNFLTQVTEDIVSRGIYTNRGLKMLFKDHLDQHMELDVDRMTEMLEKLRIDLGIPKDDTLNKLEFGYGSVLNSNISSNKTGDYSFTKPNPRPPPNSVPRSRVTGDDLPPPPPPPTDHLFLSQLGIHDSESEIELQSCKESETSLSETELSRTLKEVGVDSETTLEIVTMIKHNNPQDEGFPKGGSARGGGGIVDSIGESSDDDGNSGESLKKHGIRREQICSMSQTSSTTSS